MGQSSSTRISRLYPGIIPMSTEKGSNCDKIAKIYKRYVNNVRHLEGQKSSWSPDARTIKCLPPEDY